MTLREAANHLEGQGLFDASLLDTLLAQANQEFESRDI
jgi:hypothetical protein